MPAHRKNYDKAVEEYNAGKSIREVAALFGIAHSPMRRILKLRGVAFRPKLQFGQENRFFREGVDYDRRVKKITQYAIRKGVLVPAPCEACGFDGTGTSGQRLVQAHHDDYNKPLVVRWLCNACHFEWHRQNTPIRRTVPMPPMARQDYGRLGAIAQQRNKRAN